MFEAMVITLREGVEAALVLAIALSLLRKRGLDRLRWALFAGAGVAVALSAVTAVLVSRITYNQELAEGVAMLVGAVLVVSLVWWMWISAANMKSEIESGVARATRAVGDGGGALGLFVFALGMVYREGAETAIFLSAAGFNSQGLGLWLGALVGLALATVFGVLFARGSFRVPLKPFFSLTSAILLLIAVQLLVGGLHELSEGELLPSSRAEMAVIGPIVKNELLLFTLTVAMAAGRLLLEPGMRRAPAAAGEVEMGPQARLARAAREREQRLRRGLGVIGLVVVGFLTMAFVQGSKIPAKAPAQAVPITDGTIGIDAAPLRDGHMHFYQVTLGGHDIRLFAINVAGKIRTCFDACEICGDIGYFESGTNAVCRNCTSPIVLSSLGRTGGCNPIPLPHSEAAGRVEIRVQDIEALLPKLKGR